MIHTKAGFISVATLSFYAACASGQSLGTAENFAVLAGSTVTSTGPTVLEGHLGVFSGTAATGFGPGTVIGTMHLGNAVAMQAQMDLTAAYTGFAGLPSTANLTGTDLGGLTLFPGVYTFTSSAFLTGLLTLDALGDPNARFVFQIGSTLITAANASVVTINGADGCDLFWQVGSSATLGAGTNFEGSILAQASITLVTGASVREGRLLARDGAVTLDSNMVSTNCNSIPGPGAAAIFSAFAIGMMGKGRRRAR